LESLIIEINTAADDINHSLGRSYCADESSAEASEDITKTEGIKKSLPSTNQLLSVAKYDPKYHPNIRRRGAARAAGWGRDFYLASRSDSEQGEIPEIINLENGDDGNLSETHPVIVCAKASE
jgi:hypothetical protein